jgi:hypothetical protein
MNVFRGAFVLLLALIGTLTLGFVAHRHRLFDMGPGSGSIVDAMNNLARLEQENAELDRVSAMLLRIQHSKAEVTSDVIAGRVSLPAAAARFRASTAELPAPRRGKLEDIYAGSSDGERECRRVIAFIRAALSGEPARRDLVVARLESELRDCLQGDGSLRLPEIDSAQAQPALVADPAPAQVEAR